MIIENLREKKIILNESELKNFAISFAKQIENKDLICLDGDLGSGKTFFIKNLCEYFGNSENIKISSPSFLFYHFHNFEKIKIWHYDFYRFENQISESELINIDFFEALENGCVFVEWANKFSFDRENLNCISINIEFHEENQEFREYWIKFNPKNNKWNNFFNQNLKNILSA